MIKFNDLVKLAKGAHSVKELRSVVFDGKSAITAAPLDWMAGVPCSQPALSAPVVVPVEAIQAHMLKSRHLVVMPDHLTNGQGLVTPFNKSNKWDDSVVLGLMPAQPEADAVSFSLELNALDRVLVAAGKQDIRYLLNGVMFDLTDGMLVGCDGHRLHAYSNRVPQAFADAEKRVEVIYGRDPLRWILNSASPSAHMTIWNATETKGPKTALLQMADGFVWIRNALDGQYPEWRRVVPAPAGRPVWGELNPLVLSAAVETMGKATALATGSKGHSVTFDFGNAQVFGPDAHAVLPVTLGLNTEQADIDLEALRDGLWCGVEADYLQDLADCVTGSAKWLFAHEATANQALLVVDDDFRGVVMPLRGHDKPRMPEPVKKAKPAAMDAMAAQLVAGVVEKAHEAAKTAQKARKPRKVAPVVKVAQEEPETV
ncbi:DNA polymerase III subunit beta [Comamonadaceae bacterium]